MRIHNVWARGSILIGVAIVLPWLISTGAAAQSTGVAYHFPQPPIAPAGSLGPNGTASFTLRVTDNGSPDPGAQVYLCQCNGNVGATAYVPGDATTVPASQCGGTSQLPSNASAVLCTADAKGQILLTYHAPANPPAQGRADWLATDSLSRSHLRVVDHYVYTTVYRFSPSPIAPSGGPTPGAPVSLTLTADDGLDQGVSGSVVYLSFKQATGGGSASVGTTALTSTPTPFTTDTTGALQVTYTAPSVLPASGQDSIQVQDAASSPTGVNSDSYAFAASAPVLSVGNVDVVEGDQPAASGPPSTPADFTVTVSPELHPAMTVQYVTICGIGDKGCSEDFSQRPNPITVHIAKNQSSAIINVPQFDYVGGTAGETYNEGWYVELENPEMSSTQQPFGVVGRSVGEGVLLPDVEGVPTPLADLYVGDAGLVPTTDSSGEPLYFTVTLGAQVGSTVTFSYTTADDTAFAGSDYTATSGTATINPGFTSFVIPVTLLPNAPPSAAKTFTLTISNPSGGLTIARPTGTGTILTS